MENNELENVNNNLDTIDNGVDTDNKETNFDINEADGKESTNQEKLYPEAEVKKIREESKKRRLLLDEYSNLFKDLVGEDTKDLEKIKQKINEFKSINEKKQHELNQKIIKAELRLKSEYDSKLLEKLIDFSKIEITDDGVKGIDEQILELEKDFPYLKKTATTGKAVKNVESNKTDTKIDELRRLMGLK